MAQIGRFFSLQQGRVGQYLSPRVLVVRSPFWSPVRLGEPQEVCYFGFETLNQVQKFARYLSGLGSHFQIHQRQILPQYPYEVRLIGDVSLAKMLAYWERTDPAQAPLTGITFPLQPVQRPTVMRLAA